MYDEVASIEEVAVIVFVVLILTTAGRVTIISGNQKAVNAVKATKAETASAPKPTAAATARKEAASTLVATATISFTGKQAVSISTSTKIRLAG